MKNIQIYLRKSYEQEGQVDVRTILLREFNKLKELKIPLNERLHYALTECLEKIAK
jgi:hypothetical protein